MSEITETTEWCAARRPIAGPGAVVAFLTCNHLDGHDGPHMDVLESVEWRAVGLFGCGGIALRMNGASHE